MPKYGLVELAAVGSEDQDKVPGLIFVAHLTQEVITSKSLEQEDNISTSVESEFGPEEDQEDILEEHTTKEKPNSNMPDKVLPIRNGELRIQSRAINSIHTSVEVLTLANTPEMMQEEHGGLVTCNIPIKSD